ncbi:MAG: aminotransferase class V-fold PLP-dependent enzyme, partial [Thermodesulfobacteriota bacterium]
MIYLDNAATSYPKPEEVYARVDEIFRTVGGNSGRGSHRMALEAGRVIFRARESLGKLLGVPDASRIVFTKNATEAMNVALKGFFRPGDHVVTTAFEHNSVARPLRKLERGGVGVTKVTGSRGDLIEPSDIEKALTADTKLVCIVHASNVFGTIQPIEAIGELCRRKGVPFMVDAAQTAGALPLDISSMNVDIVVGTGHKALFGPQGTGFLYLGDGVEPPPLIDGGVGEQDDEFELPDRLETGTMNTPGIGGLGAGVEFLLTEGVGRVREKEGALVS